MTVAGEDTFAAGLQTGLFVHLLELRTRLIKAIATVVLLLVALVPVANRLYSLLAAPLVARLPQGAHLIATGADRGDRCMARGITQEQVSAAADALVAASERPTVEKIRAQLGTGSPNTVTRMLETWRGDLAARMSQVLALPDVPTEVGQAFVEVWRLAVTHAQSLAQASLAQEQQALLAAQASLTQERKIWEIAVTEAQTQALNAGQAREVAETRLVDVQRLVEQQAGQLAELLHQRDGLQQRAEQLTEALDTHKATATAEREAQAAHVRAVEDRAHAEIDRAREETKTLQAVLRQKEREASTVASRLETAEAAARAAERLATESGARATTLEQQLARLDGLPGALLAAQQTMQTALQHEAELQTKLNQRATGTKIRSAPRKRKPRQASEAPK